MHVTFNDMKNYHHEVLVDKDKKILEIYRVDDAGGKEFYTSTSLPSDESGIAEFAKILGENLLLDSPNFRSVLGI